MLEGVHGAVGRQQAVHLCKLLHQFGVISRTVKKRLIPALLVRVHLCAKQVGVAPVIAYVLRDSGQAGVVAVLPGQEVDPVTQHGRTTGFQRSPGAHACRGVFSGHREDKSEPVHEGSVLLCRNEYYINVELSTYKCPSEAARCMPYLSILLIIAVRVCVGPTGWRGIVSL
ncbi:hypothetical protein D3C85_1174910 [compost metagenome]